MNINLHSTHSGLYGPMRPYEPAQVRDFGLLILDIFTAIYLQICVLHAGNQHRRIVNGSLGSLRKISSLPAHENQGTSVTD